MKNPYKNFSKYLLRTPLLSIDFLFDLTREKDVLNDKLFKAFENPVIKEAIFLASRQLYQSLNNWTSGKELDAKKEKQLRISFLKYLTRMSTRCTPFGTLAGISMGHFTNEPSKVILNSNHEKFTRLDMNYLVSLSQALEKHPSYLDKILFYSNSSLFKIGEKWRYIEYYYRNGKRKHNLSSVDNTPYLEHLILRFKSGAYLKDLRQYLIDQGFQKDEVLQYQQELLNSQIFVSELEPSVSGTDLLDHIISTLERIGDDNNILKLLKEVKSDLLALNKQFGASIQQYESILHKLQQIKISMNFRSQFQVDTLLNVESNSINYSFCRTSLKALTILNKLDDSSSNESRNLKEFKKAFKTRYESRKENLSKVLDYESGLSFLQGTMTGIGDNNPLLDDLIMVNLNSSPVKNLMLDKSSQYFRNMLHKHKLKDDSKIVIDNNYIKNLEPNWKNLPTTFSSLIEVYNINGKEKLFVDGFSFPSASCLISRFGHVAKDILELVAEINDAEKSSNPDKLTVEIVHLPEDRAGNIILRPSFREYEIPYLSRSVLDTDKQIMISDIEIEISSNDKISLYSKKHKKYIKAYLSNAHNYFFNSLPVYQFLCELQSQGIRKLSFNFLKNTEANFLPRVEFEDIIFSKAKWILRSADILELNAIKQHPDLIPKLEEFRSSRNIPELALLIEGDNELLINFSNKLSIEMFLDSIKKSNTVELSEFLFKNDGLVKNSKGESFTNQVVFSVFKND